MVVLYNKTTKKWFFFYLHVLTLCVIMALVGKRKHSGHPDEMTGSFLKKLSRKERD